MTAREGVDLLYLIMRDAWFQRTQLAALGVQEVDTVDEMLDKADDDYERLRSGPATVDRATRAAEVAAFMAAVGGEF